jgi:hypothetical protein
VHTAPETAKFIIRVWSSTELIAALLRTYPSLPDEIRSELPSSRSGSLSSPCADAAGSGQASTLAVRVGGSPFGGVL